MLKNIGNVFLTLLLMVVTTIALTIVVIPKIMGAAPLTVYTGSMVPTFNPNDLIVVKPLDETAKENLQVGDIVTFQPVSGDPTLITHRIIEKRVSNKGITFITQGDANDAPDDELIADQIMAKYLYRIPLMGYITFSGGMKTDLFYIIAGGFVLVGVITLFVPERKKKKSEDELEDDLDKEKEINIKEESTLKTEFKNPFI